MTVLLKVGVVIFALLCWVLGVLIFNELEDMRLK